MKDVLKMKGKMDKKENSGVFGNRVNETTSYISGAAVFALVCFTIAYVILRKAINYPIPGFYDIAGLLGVIIYSFGIVYAAIKAAHISVRFVFNRLPKRFQKKLQIFNRIVVIGSSILFAYASANAALDSWMQSAVTTQLHIPLNPFRLLIVLAFVYLTVLLLIGHEISSEEGE